MVYPDSLKNWTLRFRYQKETDTVEVMLEKSVLSIAFDLYCDSDGVIIDGMIDRCKEMLLEEGFEADCVIKDPMPVRNEGKY